MKNMSLFLLAALGALSASALEISKVPEGKLCAFSFTHDDGSAVHYTKAFPLHRKYAMPGTFLIITDRVEDGAVWLRAGAEEKVCVNGKPVIPNAQGGILVQLGDMVSVVTSYAKSGVEK